MNSKATHTRLMAMSTESVPCVGATPLGADQLNVTKAGPVVLNQDAVTLGVSERIRWLGLRRDPERWYGAADVLVLPTRYEPFGNVHLEALASGLPVVTTTAAGGAEVVEEGKNGAVVAPNDAAALAAAVTGLLSENRAVLTEAARRAAEPYTHQRQAEAFERLYREFP